jgi:hypothetical protein
MLGTGIMLALVDATSCATHRSAFSCDLTIVWRIHADKQTRVSSASRTMTMNPTQ